MKTLLVLRHAKSGWDDPVARDFDRPLNPKGQRAAVTMGRYLREQGLRFDHVAASPAVRVQETLAQVATGYGAAIAPAWDQKLYLASVGTLLDAIEAFPDSAETVLLSGHNPGLEELVLDLTADSGELRGEVARKFPTAALAELRFTVDRWADAPSAGAELRRFVRPRDLDPSLGPDG
ncbi:SixA phosphatase family protein [Sphingomonas sp. HT-1]|uniref:SixA phosphatase family protein n=1 Tax=unclassified Sphingomonas TaxID=196159 RepID=UPI0002D63720|nr:MULTISPECIES: histidine phosphatase family protein [unclassified Sphingomonas]KTF70409.1 histidine phosphatase family protein [Sphingomonas sp. WG]